ncbi:MAG: DsbE family thiol:disulfide interchange protein [Alphaproteobacteria bacterium]|nr:DsbE family thiol:disulfide interchange protein [Alphaproteobacteria bacterium]
MSDSPERGATPETPHSTARRLWFVLPVLVFGAIAVAFAVGLGRQSDEHARDLPSALVDKPLPAFNLPPVEGHEVGLSDADVKAPGVSLLNVFASWCGPCRVEHSVWMAYAKQPDAVPLFGLNYKDQPSNAAAWLQKLGDPYKRIGADLDGRVGIDFGVYGVPETFVIDRAGRIVFKHIGVMTWKALDETILPLITRLRG